MVTHDYRIQLDGMVGNSIKKTHYCWALLIFQHFIDVNTVSFFLLYPFILAVEILADITQNSRFGEEDIEKEKGIILRELQVNFSFINIFGLYFIAINL